MRIAKSDAVPIALLAAAALSAGTASLLLNAQPSRLALALIGVCAYAVLARLGDYDPHLLCDTVQSGDAAIGTLALAAGLFVTAQPLLLLAIVVMAIIPYQLFMKLALAPAKKEIALCGGAAQGILAVMAFFIVTGGHAGSAGSGSVFTGYFAVIGVHPALSVSSLVIVIIIFLVMTAGSPELKLLSQGPPFSRRPLPVRAGAGAALVMARGLLAAISLVFAGWTCGIGISVRRMHRGALPDTIMFLSLVCLGQVSSLIEALSGPLPAAAVSWACSYAVFFLYLYRKVHVYDRYQQS